MFRTIALASAMLLASTSFAYAHEAGPSDPQIAHIAYTAGQLDVEAANQALMKSTNAEVRAFAETMKRDHTAVNEQALALLGRLHVTPENNPTSEALTKAAADERQRLAAMSGEDFDKAYIANEVTFHRTVNDALSGTLIPNADNAELKALLERGLALFREHQTHAEQMAAGHVH